MKPEPLKGKLKYKSQLLESTEVIEVFDVKSAVEWLKARLDTEQDKELVDEAFEDVK